MTAFQCRRPSKIDKNRQDALPLFDSIFINQGTDEQQQSTEKESPPTWSEEASDSVEAYDLAASLPERSASLSPLSFASGEKAKARDILAAIRTLQRIEHEERPVSEEERQVLSRFAVFGPVALSIFPDPLDKKEERRRESLGRSA
jgi:hypothetical protein